MLYHVHSWLTFVLPFTCSASAESPQWRRGPSHKPVLCNACGTRYRRTNQLGPVTPRPGAPPRKRGLQNLSPLAEEPAAKGARLEAELGPGHHLVAAAVERA